MDKHPLGYINKLPYAEKPNIIILSGRDQGKIAKATKVYNDGNISVRLGHGKKIIVRLGNYRLLED